jgi:hypothetical protein
MFFIYVDQKIKVATFPWTYFYIEPNNKKKKKKKKKKIVSEKAVGQYTSFKITWAIQTEIGLWFIIYLLLVWILDPKSPVEKSTGKPLVVEWEKMSKSKYNGVDPQVIYF